MTDFKINFVIAGQPKSGTTALAQFLSQHPDICMSYPKEPGYFATDFMDESDEFHGQKKYFKARTLEDYIEHFTDCGEEQLKGDASTCYTYSAAAAENIYKNNPQAKVIIMLRNPVDFMHSLHMQYVNETVENITDFEKALATENLRMEGKKVPPRTRCPSYHYYLKRANYYPQIKRYFDVFPSNQIFILITEEFKDNNEKFYNRVLNFLGVDDSFTPNFKIVHGSKKPRVAWLNKAAHTMWLKNMLYKVLGPKLYTNTHKQVNKLLLVKKSRNKMGEGLRKELRGQLNSSVEKTSELIDKDLASIWK